MSTSTYAGIIRTNFPLAGDSPMGAFKARDVVFNNLLHYADEYAQVRTTIALLSTNFASDSPSYLQTEDTVEADTWQEIITQYGIVPPVRAGTGGTYSFRVRVAGFSSAGHSVQFRVGITPVDALALPTNTDNVFETTATTSTTAAWLTGATLGTGAYTTKMVITSDNLGLPTSYTSKTDVGGDPADGLQYAYKLSVWGKTANASSTPRLSALYVAEYVGPNE